ncbi:MAG TPA: glycosyltransferase family 2 protein [Azospirillaceae bacterium]|nr:glycosyltransferase family 2 protein [Azospirillaceae bacterium]
MFVALALFGLAALFLAAALHPFTTYPLSLMALRRLWPEPLAPEIVTPADRQETFAVCVCAYNEETVIRAKVENLLAMRKALGGLEILVYVDAATDRTAAILREYQDELTLLVSPERRGKTYGMNLLVRMAKADVVIFTDANVIVDPQMIGNLKSYFADPSVGCVCGHLIYTNGDDNATAQSGSLYWKLEEAIKQMESETGSAMGADGSLFAIRRRLHKPVPPDIIDDMFVSFNILLAGHRVVRAPDVLAFEQTTTSAGDEFRRKIRIACQSFNIHRMLWPRLKRMPMLDVYKYVSHKLLRWLTIYNLALAGLFTIAGVAVLPHPLPAALALGLGTATFVAGWAMKLKPMPQIVDILTAFLGTGIGVWRSLRGARFQTWTPAASVRVMPQVTPPVEKRRSQG